MSQSTAILEYMQKHGSITPIEVLNHCGSFRLGARIWDLRHKGYMISKSMVYKLKPDGTVTKFARYRLEEDND